MDRVETNMEHGYKVAMNKRVETCNGVEINAQRELDG